ncbi:MAG: AtpZ/AtpI family protein [Bacteroidales bacterium]
MFNLENQENGPKNTRNNKQKENKRAPRKDKNPLREYARYSALAFQMMAVILLGVFGGIKLDERISGINFPLFTLVGTVVGVALSVYYAIRDFVKF